MSSFLLLAIYLLIHSCFDCPTHSPFQTTLFMNDPCDINVFWKLAHHRFITLQVNLCQKLLFLHQLTHNITRDCLLNYKFSSWGEHVVYNFFLTFRTISIHNMFSPCPAKKKSFWKRFTCTNEAYVSAISAHMQGCVIRMNLLRYASLLFMEGRSSNLRQRENAFSFINCWAENCVAKLTLIDRKEQFVDKWSRYEMQTNLSN